MTTRAPPLRRPCNLFAKRSSHCCKRPGTLQKISAAFAGLFIENLSGFDLSQYDALTFDIAHFEGDNQYAIKLDCFYPCFSGDYLIERIGDGWQTVRVPLGQLEAQGLVLTNVNTGLVIWSTAHDGNRFRIDEVRFIKDLP